MSTDHWLDMLVKMMISWSDESAAATTSRCSVCGCGSSLSMGGCVRA
jgi:hypothetical protein